MRHQAWKRHTLRVIYFGDPEWGFSDSAIPKLHALFEKSDLPVDIWHSVLTIDFAGEERRAEFARMRLLLEELKLKAEFERCQIGIAEGEVENALDIFQITAKAMANGKNR
jgi:hypothetical protein